MHSTVLDLSSRLCLFFLALMQGVVLDFHLGLNTVEGKSFMRYQNEQMFKLVFYLDFFVLVY